MTGFDPLALVVVSVFVAVVFLIIWIGLGVTRAREEMIDRLALYGRSNAPSVRDDELAKPLAQRTIGPIVLKMSGFLKR
ncbi:MAG: hypothetical protein WEB67_13390, partial [Acidimicrobiia bacterium]